MSFGSTAHSLCSRIGPVSSPSSAQNTVKPAFLSPWISVLETHAFTKKKKEMNLKTCHNTGNYRTGGYKVDHKPEQTQIKKRFHLELMTLRQSDY